jgi:N-ethylmaleimide reductase
VAGWKRVTDAVHAEGGLIFLQLWHVGRLSHPLIKAQGELPVAPSAIRAEGELYTHAGFKAYETPRALELDEIPGLVSDFARGAGNAKRVSFDGVEIHGANGHLVDQFLRDSSNHRAAPYAGSLQKRARFLREVVEATIRVFCAERVGVRLWPNLNIFSISDSNSKATFDRTAGMLAEYGLAYLHVA